MHSSQQITFPTQGCLILYSFRANFMHSLIIIIIIIIIITIIIISIGVFHIGVSW